MQTVLAVSMRSWWSTGRIPVKVTWVHFPARISNGHSKLLRINDLSFQFLTKDLHICSYKFSYRISDQGSTILYKFATFLQFSPSFMVIWPLQENSHFRLYLQSSKQWIYVLCNFYLIDQLKSIWIYFRKR